MSRSERIGNRVKRETKKPFRKAQIGYYVLITDTQETECNYFNGLREDLPDSIRNNLVIKIIKTKTKDMIQKAVEDTKYDPQYREPWIIFDCDQNQNFDDIIHEALGDGISVAWSNPCFEIWLFAYFGKMPTIKESHECCRKFGQIYKSKTKQEYSKSDKNLYKHLCKYGDEKKAINLAKNKYRKCVASDHAKPSEMFPCTTVYELVEDIKNKIENSEPLN